MLAIWSLVPLPFLEPAWTSGSSQFTYCWKLAWRILKYYFTSVWDERNCAVVWAFFGLAFLWDSFLLHSKLCLQKLTQCCRTEARFAFKNRDWNISLCPQSYQIGSKCLINIYWVHDLHGASHNQLHKQHLKGQALFLEITLQTGVPGHWLFREQSVATAKLKGQRAETESPVGHQGLPLLLH